MTLACCVLHYFLRAESALYMSDEGGADYNFVFKFELFHQDFLNEGAVQWQNDKV